MKIINKIYLRISILVLAVAIISCDSDDDVSSDKLINMRDWSIADYIDNSSRTEYGSYNILNEAIEKAGMVEVLNSGAFTLLAPTDEAFISSGVFIDDLTAEQLTEIINYHLIPSEVDLAGIDGVIAMNNGANIITIAGCVNGFASAGILLSDINLTNGVLHSLDEVLTSPTQTISAVLSSHADLGLFNAAVVKSGQVIGSTVFAPTDAAMEAAGLDQIAIDAATAADLLDVVEFHMFSSAEISCGLEDGRYVTLAGALDVTQGVDISVASGLTINFQTATEADIIATNGIVHVLDGVVSPQPTLLEGFGSTELSGGNDGVLFNGYYTGMVRVGLDQILFSDFQTQTTAISIFLFDDTTYPVDADLEALIRAHTFDGKINIFEMAEAGSARLEAIDGSKYFISATDDGNFINGAARNIFGAASTTSYPVYNGQMSSINMAMTALPSTTIIEELAAGVNYTLFAAALDAMDIVSAVADYTVLAIDNATFTAEYGYTTVAEVEASDTSEFSDLSNHVIEKVYIANDVWDGSYPDWTSVSGEKLVLTTNGADIGILVDASDLSSIIDFTALDLFGSNGVVHEVSGVIVF